MPGIELNAIARVGQYLGHQAVKLQEFFLCHVMILLDDWPDAERRARLGGSLGRCAAGTRRSQFHPADSPGCP